MIRPDVAVELAAATITQIATKLVEAGANVIFIREEILPTLTPQTAEAWAAALAPAINIIRFYQALPVLQITNAQAFAENSAAIFQQKWDCTVCPTLPSPPNATFLHSPGRQRATSWASPCPPPSSLTNPAAQNFRQSLHTIINGVHPVLITTANRCPSRHRRQATLKTMGGYPSLTKSSISTCTQSAGYGCRDSDRNISAGENRACRKRSNTINQNECLFTPSCIQHATSAGLP